MFNNVNNSWSSFLNNDNLIFSDIDQGIVENNEKIQSSNNREASSPLPLDNPVIRGIVTKILKEQKESSKKPSLIIPQDQLDKVNPPGYTMPCLHSMFANFNE